MLLAFDGTPGLRQLTGICQCSPFPVAGRSAPLAAADFLNTRTIACTTGCSKPGLCGTQRTLNLS